MKAHQTEIPGLLELNVKHSADERGGMVKTFSSEEFASIGLPVHFSEALHTRSRQGVIRGLHFQTPPAAQAKVVFCVRGRVLDVVVDLRRGSPAYLKALSRTLVPESGVGLYVPEGCAHGFCALEDSLISYLLTGPYSAKHDAGVLWNSIDFDWPVREPLISEKDSALVPLGDFESPFSFQDDAGPRAGSAT